MRRVLIALLIFVVLAALWVFGGSLGPPGTYRVVAQSDGTARLVLEVTHPGLFLDLAWDSGQPVTVAGKVAASFTPWPLSKQKRLLTFFRGPVVMTLAQGAGPFDVRNLPAPATGTASRVTLPDGWSQVSHFVGNLVELQTEPVRVFGPQGMDNAPEALARVNSLMKTAAAVIGAPVAREQVVVIGGSSPLDLAYGAVDLWIPEYPSELGWWGQGLKEFFTMQVMDTARLWSNEDQKSKWMKEPQRGKGFRMALWLHLSLGFDNNQRVGLADLFHTALSVKRTQELMARVKEVADTTTWDTMDRMLKGRVPWPAM